MSRRALSAATLTVLVVLLAVGAVIGWKSLTAPFNGTQSSATTPTKKPSCDPRLTKGAPVRTSDVTVSVYNAGTRTGLAGQTQQQLVARGFIPGDVGNAPGNLGGVRFVRILAPSQTDPAARLVALQFGRHTFVQRSSQNLGPGVQVVVGDRFVGLVRAPRSIKAHASGSGC
jgi:hypothetical protein